MNVELKKLKFSIMIAVSCMAVAILILLWLFTRSFISIKVSPQDATLEIDGNRITTSAAGVAKKSFTPGLHTISVNVDGYIGYSQSLDFKRGFPKQIAISLKELPKATPVSTEAEFLAKGNDFSDGYYLGNGGRTIYKTKVALKDSGEIAISDNKAITDARLSNIKEIIWSPTKELALFRKNNGDITLFDFMKYDFVDQTESPWGHDIGSIAWAPDNSKIAYFYAPASGEKTLVFANITNTEITRVANFAELGIENPILKWSPDSEGLLIIPRSADASKNKIYFFSISTRNLKELTENGNQVAADFSPDGNKIMYATYSKDASNPTTSLLSIMDRDGSNKQSLDVRADLDKTAWSKDSRNIVVATYDPETKQESLFKFDTQMKARSGFILNNLGKIYINRLIISDNDKIILYETNDGIYALMVG